MQSVSNTADCSGRCYKSLTCAIRSRPSTGAVLPLALGLAITALLLLMVACRLRLVKQKLKKARPITSEESDYLINGMYL